MKWSNGVIAGTLVMLVAACGGVPKSVGPVVVPGNPAASASATTTPAPNLNAEMLSLSDFPAGWSVVPNNGSTAGEPKCLQNVKTDLKATDEAEATFEYGSSGPPLLDEALYYLPGRGQAAATDASRILSRCGRIRLRYSRRVTLTGNVRAIAFPAVADQSAAYQINLSAKVSAVNMTITAGLDLIMFRKADTVALISFADVNTPDTKAVEHYVQEAATKLS